MNISTPNAIIRRLKKEAPGYLFILPQFLLFVGMMIYPLISGFKLSLYKINLKNEVFVGFDNYIRLLNDPNFLKSVQNTILFVVSIVTLSVVFGIIVSAAVFDKSQRYVSFIRGCYYIPVAVSMVVMSVVWSFLFNPAQGLINYLIGLGGHQPINFLGDKNLVMPIIIFVTFVSNIGQIIVLYIASMISIPNEIFEAAEVDGVSGIKQLLNIILPLVKPTTMYVVVTQTIAIMKIFVVIQLMTNGGPNYASVTLMYYLYEKAFKMNGKTGEAAAIGVIMFVVCLILSLIQYFLLRDKKTNRRR